MAIIILHYKNLPDTRACLLSLQKIDYPAYSIILVNNDSSEHGRSLQDEFPEIELIQNQENLGFAEGNNVGIRHALADKSVEAVLILNNDTTVEPNFLSEMVKIEADMIAPRMLQFADKNKIDNLGLQLMASGLPFNRRNENEKLFCPSGGAALYTRKLLETIAFAKNNVIASVAKQSYNRDEQDFTESYLNPDGQIASARSSPRNDTWYFDPIFFAYCEDVDLGWRARNAGFECGYATRAIVYHKGSAATSKMSDLAVYNTYRNLIWTQFKNLPLSLLLWQSPWLALGWLFLFALYTAKGRPGIICKAFFDGLLGLRFMFKRRREAQKQITASNQKILSWFGRGLFPKSFVK